MKRIWISVLTAFLSCVAVTASGDIVEEGCFWEYICSEIQGNGIVSLLLLIGLSIFYYKVKDDLKEIKHWTINLLAIMFSAFMLIGISYSNYSGTNFITHSLQQMIIATITFVGYFVLFSNCLKCLFLLLDKKNIWNESEVKSISKRIDKHYLLFVFCVIAVFWLPYIIVNFPGSVPYDGYRQLNMYYGIEAISNHHPWITTLVIGTLFQIGRTISDNFGVFLIIIVFYIVQAYCYAFVCNKIKEWNAPNWLRRGSLVFFAIVPAFSAYSQTVMKDGIYTAIFAVFITLFIECLMKKNIGLSKREVIKKYGILLLVELLVCFTRNNGVYIVLIADIVLIFFVIRERKKVVILLTALLCMSYSFIGNNVATSLGIKEGSIREVLSMPFQQTGRYLRDYPDDVSETEKEAISKVLPYDIIAARYKPELADGVKDVYIQSASKQDLINYFKAWFTMFLKHPEVYVSAFFNQTYGYYYPFSNYTELSAFQFYIMGEPLATGEFDIYYVFSPSVRENIIYYTEAWRTLPGLAQIVNPGTYTWILLFMVGYLIYRKQWKKTIPLLPAIMNIAICIVSPVNGYLRYAMPLMACMPILFYWSLCKENTNETVVESVNKDE